MAMALEMTFLRSAEPVIYVAVELSKKTWVVAVLRPDRDRPSIHKLPAGDLTGLLAKMAAGTGNERVVLCYEAGYDGFWLARVLQTHGVTCRVLDPASLQVSRRARRAKTDRLDALALLRALIGIERGERHVCAVVRVPSVEEEDARRSHRERQRLIRERTGHINRIKGLLFAQGIRNIEPARRLSRLDFSVLRTGEGRPLPERLRRELEREYARLDLVEEQLRAVEKERDRADEQDPTVERKRQALIAVQGIGPVSAAILAREVFYRAYANRRQLGSYLGLTSSARDSGSRRRCQGISKAGNAWARRVLIEIAWLWRRHQPESRLARWYAERAAGQTPRIRRILLVALARKIAVALWQYVEMGVVPEGVTLARQVEAAA
jgi:transposase